MYFEINEIEKNPLKSPKINTLADELIDRTSSMVVIT